MSSEWPRASLREFVDLLAGFAFKSSGYTDVSEDVRLLRGDNIAPGKVRWDGVKRWPKDGEPDLSRYVLEPGDVVLAMDRPWIPAGLKVAQVTKADTPSYLVQRVARLRAASRSDCDFLFALLSAPDFDSYIQNATTGTAVPHISAKQILDYEFRLPPASARAEIGALAAEVNDRITLLRETNATLEAIAQALFKSWFVDFDPVRAKMAGRAPEGMDEATAALFPDALEETALGLVPKGWVVQRLGDVVERVTKGTTPTTLKRPFVDSGINFVKAESMTDDGDFIPAKFAFIDSETHELLKRSQLKAGDVLISIAGTIGRTAIVTEDFLPANTNQAVAIVRPTPDGVPSGLIVRFLNRAESKQLLGERVVQAVQANLSLGTLSDLKLVLPGSDLIRHLFKMTFEPIDLAVTANRQKLRTLATLRDTLLPRLISGQLRLPEAQAQLEDALA